MRTVSRLRLLFCFCGRVTPTLRLSHCRIVHSFTCCPVETMQPHQKKTEFRLYVLTICSRRDARCTPCQFSFGGAGGIRTPVQNTVLFASYNHIAIIYGKTIFVQSISFYSEVFFSQVKESFNPIISLFNEDRSFRLFINSHKDN